MDKMMADDDYQYLVAIETDQYLLFCEPQIL